MSNKEELLKDSWFNCYKQGVKKDLKAPKIFASKNELEKIIAENTNLIEVFETQARILDKNLNKKSMFFLVDIKGVVLSHYFIGDIEKYNDIKIREGTYLTEESLGTNAVSLAMLTEGYIVLDREEHYCNFFSKWNCLSTPIKIDNQVIGFLAFAIVNSEISKNDELMFKLLLNKIINSMRDKFLYCSLEESTLDKVDLEILKLSANGYIIEEISKIIHMSESTIKSRRKKICRLLNAKNMTHATVKAIKCKCLGLDKIE